jgi:osmotically-inducible protein OsmY
MNQRRNEFGRTEKNAGRTGSRHPQQDWSNDDHRGGGRYPMDRNHSGDERDGGRNEAWRGQYGYDDGVGARGRDSWSQEMGQRYGGGYAESEWGGSGQYDPRMTGGGYGNYDTGRTDSGGAYSGSPGGQQWQNYAASYGRQQYDAPYDYAYGHDYGQPSQGYSRNTGSYAGNYSGVPHHPDFQGRGRYQGSEPWSRGESGYGYGYQGGPSGQGGIGGAGGSQFGQSGQYGYSSKFGSGGQYGSNYSGGHYGQGRFAQGGSFAGTQANQESRGYQGVGPKGYTRSDERLKEEISERLTDDSQIDASDISIECSNGKITLSGQVDERWMKHRVEDLVDRSSGVKDIDNRLTVRQRHDTRNSESAQHEDGAYSNGNGQRSTANAGADNKKRQ